MSHPPENAVIQVAALLRSYVAANPEAADTVEGIARWWFPAAISPEAMKAAVRLLADEGTLVRRVAHDGTVVYAGPGADRGSPETT